MPISNLHKNICSFHTFIRISGFIWRMYFCHYLQFLDISSDFCIIYKMTFVISATFYDLYQVIRRLNYIPLRFAKIHCLNNNFLEFRQNKPTTWQNKHNLPICLLTSICLPTLSACSCLPTSHHASPTSSAYGSKSDLVKTLPTLTNSYLMAFK